MTKPIINFNDPSNLPKFNYKLLITSSIPNKITAPGLSINLKANPQAHQKTNHRSKNHTAQLGKSNNTPIHQPKISPIQKLPINKSTIHKSNSKPLSSNHFLKRISQALQYMGKPRKAPYLDINELINELNQTDHTGLFIILCHKLMNVNITDLKTEWYKRIPYIDDQTLLINYVHFISEWLYNHEDRIAANQRNQYWNHLCWISSQQFRKLNTNPLQFNPFGPLNPQYQYIKQLRARWSKIVK